VACSEVCVRETDIGQVQQGIERAEPYRTLGLFDGRRVVALPRADDGTETEGEGRRARQREGSVESAGRGFVIAVDDSDDKGSRCQRRGVVAAGGDRLARMAQGGFFRFLMETAA
jgi:hypothetical protein